MMDVQIVRRATELAAPTISLENLIPKRLVFSRGKFQPWHFLTKSTHDLSRTLTNPRRQAVASVPLLSSEKVIFGVAPS